MPKTNVNMYSRLLILIFSISNFSAMVPLTPPTPLVQKIAQQSLKLFGINKMPIIFMTPHIPIAVGFVILQNSKSESDDFPFRIRIRKQCKDLIKDNHIIIFSQKYFTQESYGTKKGTILHEFAHIAQFDPVTQECITNINEFPKGREQAADIRATQLLNCSTCIEEYASTHGFYEEDSYATAKEILAFSKKLAPNTLCNYHSLLLNKKSYSCISPIFDNSSLFSLTSMGLIILPGLINDLYLKHTRFAKIYEKLTVAGCYSIAIGIMYTLWHKQSIKNWIGRDIEEQIARGELEP